MKNLFILGCICLYFSSQFLSAQTRNPLVDQFLATKVSSKQLDLQDASEYVILSNHKSSTSKIEHIYFRQAVGGIGIIGTESSIHVKPDQTLLKSNFGFEASIRDKIMGTKSASLSPQLAIQKVAQQMGYSQSGAMVSKPKSYIPNSDYVFSAEAISDEDIPLTLVYKKLEHSKYILVWELSIKDIKSSDWFNFYTDASTGEIISKNNWTLTCLENHDHSANKNSDYFNGLTKDKQNSSQKINAVNTGSYNVYPLPLENPFTDPREIVINPANLNASPFGWHDVDGVDGAEYTVTRGNNVNAFENGDNQSFQPDGGDDLIFNFPFNPIHSFEDQSESAAITNLFYWNNITHDISYLYGFDEASGNFQENNYGNPGIGNDFVYAEAQSGFGTCNAMFSSPPEGIRSRMQMFICNERDSSFDNGVIIHEYGHGISIRLTGGSSNSNCLSNDEQMGEGWSDWYGSVLTIKEGDTGTDARAVGNWFVGNDENGNGIRNYPYSTDLTVNPQTYDDIKTTFGPHPLGSIWATMLWEMTWALIDVHGFDPDVYNGSGGNNMALALVTEALKFQPCDPGFVDGRDAILAADQALYGGENSCTIWEAFAKRGLGQSADQGSPYSRTDGTEAFDSPSATLTTPDVPFCETDDSQILSGGEPLGGVYIGPGVTDAGDGETYTFDPLEAGVGIHNIAYKTNTECGVNDTAFSTIEVKDENPVIECQDVTVSLDDNGIATILPKDVVMNFEPGEGYKLDQSGTFSPENIDGIGTLVALGDDQVMSGLPINFEFSFYGNSFTEFNISSNGFISFLDAFSSGCCSGQALPDPSQPNNLIALGWTDLYPPRGGSISYATIGSSPNQILVVQFENIPNISDNSKTVSAQIKLFEGSNRIEIHSENVEGFGLTQGIENFDGSEALPVPNRNREAVSITNDVVAFVPNQGGFPDNCGLETIVTLDKDTFNCNDLGENTVTATATDAAGNSSSCTAIVTVLSDIQVTFEALEEEFCVYESPVTGLGGGLPLGGVYSGNGVTDDGNGETFTFDPNAAGEGQHTLTYAVGNVCGTNNEAFSTVEVIDPDPVIECQDVTLSLDDNGIATILPTDVVMNFEPGEGYTLDQSGTFSPENIDGIGTLVALGDDQVSNELPINFEFSFYGNPYTSFKISSNGFISFLDAFSTGCCSGQALPDPSQPNNLIALGWTDLYPPRSGSISYATIGSSPNQVLVVQFENIPNISDNSKTVSAQIKLFEGSNRIEIHSENVEGFGLTQGIENFDGSEALPVPDRNRAAVSITNDVVAFIPNQGGFPDNCGLETIVTLDKDTFNCNDLGENTVTATATDTAGNSSSCTAIVTVISDIQVTFEALEEEFCIDQNPVTGLGGGLPLGGVYSGNGVTDDGNGETFTFDPIVAGEGITSITYTIVDSCSEINTASSDVEVQPSLPVIECQDITVSLNTNGTVTITPEQVLGMNTEDNKLAYVLSPGGSNNLRRYTVNSDNTLTIDPEFFGSTGFLRNFAIEKNPSDQNIYLLAGNSSQERNLYAFDIETSTSEFLTAPVSVNGDTDVQAMTFDSNNNLYFVFKSGEINKYNLVSDEMSPFAIINLNGAVGLTFDKDENRLIHSSGLSPVSLKAIDISTGNVSDLFTFFTPQNTNCTAQAISYIGNGKLIASSTFNCDIIYSIDLNTETAEILLSPTQSFISIKDIMIQSSLPVDNCNNEPLSFSISPDTFGCDDIGENIVTLTATDNAGNSSSCTSTVTIEEKSILDFECIESLELALDENRTATLTEDMIFDSMPNDPCENGYTVSFSQSSFDCSDLIFEGIEDLIINGSFENELTGWSSTIENGTDQGGCQQAWKTLENSTSICCCVNDIFPTDGSFASFTSFDGNANTRYILEQSLIYTTNGSSVLSFDWVAEFDLKNYGATLDRKLEVGFFDSNDNLIEIIYTDNIPAGETSSINESLSFDVTAALSNYNGQEIKLKFLATVPELGVGPSKAMIDNVSLLSNSPEIPVEITVTDNSGNSRICTVPVTITDPNQYCTLSTQKEFFENALNLYPNPTRTSFTLSWNQEIDIKRLEILDLTGKLIFQQQNNFIGKQTSVDVSNLASGMYLIRVTSGDKQAIKKLIVE